ncbi:MAG: extracellular solute-binding protein [Eubacteriales bacterium]|nr:extracellular solute-binding protein [Eubacteriales bacterium]
MKKWTKKLTAALAVAAMTAGSVTCAFAEEAEYVKKEYTGDEVTLRFSWWGGDERLEATLAVIEAFEADYPSIHIEAEYGSSDGYHDKLATQLASGTAPDLIQIDPETMPTYVATNPDYFVSYDEAGFDFSKYDDAFLRLQINGYYDGQQLGIPTGIAGPAMLVNQELADAIGIDFTSDYTWDDLIEWGKKVREYDSEMYLMSANKSYIATFVFYNYAKQLTGQTLFDVENGVLNITQEDMETCLSYIKELYDNEVIPPASYSAAYDGDNLQSDPNWINGKYVCTFAHVSTMNVMMAANENATWLAGNLPMMPDAKDAGWTANCPQIIAVSSTTSNVEAAMLFADYFFNNPASMSTLACTRSVPATEEARTICEADGTLDSVMMEAANICSAFGGLTPDRYASSQEGKAMVTDAIETVGYGVSEPADAAADLIAQLNSLIK